MLVACYEGGLSLIDVHTHPFSGIGVAFSGHDVANMATTHNELLDTIPQNPPTVAASLVIGQDSVAGAWTIPTSRQLAGLTRLELIGDRLRGVELTHRRPSTVHVSRDHRRN